MNKKQSQKAHARRRIEQRYGVSINRHKMRDFVLKIQNNDCVHVETQSNRVTVKKVLFEGTEYKVVYDKNRHVVVTFLPND